MAGPKSRELLFRLLQGDFPSPAEVLGLVKAFQARQELEGQWFDLKAGALLQRKHGDEFRAAVCGFANAEGGFLLIGYDENAKGFDGVQPVAKQAPEQWTTDALGSLAAYIPPPRLHTLTIEGKPVLLVGIARATRLVFVIEDGEAVYYLRFGHQTRRMPHSLVTDLMLGRKAQPLLIGTLSGASVTKTPSETSDPQLYANEVKATIQVENLALMVARDCVAGLVAWSTRGEDLPTTLLRSVDLQEPARYSEALRLYTHHGFANLEPPALGPFQRAHATLRQWRLPMFPNLLTHPPHRAPNALALTDEQRARSRGACEARAALYLLATNNEPTWFQLTLRYDGGLTILSPEWMTKHHVRITPCLYSRPVVSLRFLNEGEPVAFPEP